jgi:hypothetical protein
MIDGMVILVLSKSHFFIPSLGKLVRLIFFTDENDGKVKKGGHRQ